MHRENLKFVVAREPQYSKDEKICARCLDGQVLFYEKENFANPAYKVGTPKVEGFSLSPGSPYHVLCYMPGTMWRFCYLPQGCHFPEKLRESENFGLVWKSVRTFKASLVHLRQFSKNVKLSRMLSKWRISFCRYKKKKNGCVTKKFKKNGKPGKVRERYLREKVATL